MQRQILGLRHDADGEWIAELSCGHRRHVRHRPPFFDEAWITTAAGRQARIGTLLDCRLCDPAPSDVGRG